MKLLNTAILKLLIYLVAGISTGYCIPWLHTPRLLYCNLFLFCCITALLFLHNRRWLFEISSAGLFLLLGYAGIQSLHPKHNLLKSPEKPELQQVILTPAKALRSTDHYMRYTGMVKSPTSKGRGEKMILRFPLKSEAIDLKPGSWYAAAATIRIPPGTRNPGEFDYRNYLRKKGIHRIADIRAESLVILPAIKSKNSAVNNLRNTLEERIKASELSPFTRGLLHALILGDRELLDQNFYNTLKETGGAHLVALSGLHIGIFTYMLGFLLWPLRKLPRGKWIHFILITVLLANYTLLTGAGSSVVRATVMFCFISYSILIQQRSSTLNALILSAFFLLLFHPAYLLDVGFQLSYTAVTGILLLYPVFNKWWQPENRILNWLWTLVTVSISAQVFTAPLTVYYFHQFPSSFLITNLVITPVITIFLGLGYIVVTIFSLGALPRLFIEAYDRSGLLIQYLTKDIIPKDYLITGLHIPDVSWVILIYMTLCLFLLCLHKKKYIPLLLTSVLLLQVRYIHHTFTNDNHQLRIYHEFGRSLVGIQARGQLTIYEYAHTRESASFPEHITNTPDEIKREKHPPHYLEYSNHRLLVIVGDLLYPALEKDPSAILLINSTRINLDRLLQRFQPEIIIADGSNYPSLVARWKNTCRQKNIPFHYTGERGYYAIER